MTDLFSGLRAWFSTSCDEDLVDEWEQHGGAVALELPSQLGDAVADDEQRITHYFTKDYWADDTVELFKRSVGKGLVILYAHWVRDCIAQQRVLPNRDTLKYIVPPMPLLVPSKPPQLVVADQTPSALNTATLNVHSTAVVNVVEHAVAADTVTTAAAEQLLPPASAPLQARIAAAITIDEEREQRYELKRQQRNQKKRMRTHTAPEEVAEVVEVIDEPEQILAHEDTVVVAASPVKPASAAQHKSPAKPPSRSHQPARSGSHSTSGDVEVNRNIWLNHPIMKATPISLRELLPFPRPQNECWSIPPIGSAASVRLLSLEVSSFVSKGTHSPSKAATPTKSPLRKKRR